MSEPGAPELKVWTDQRGRTRVSWPGRKGYPVTVRKDETPQDAYVRAVAAEALKETAPPSGGNAPGQGAATGPAAPSPGEQPPRRRGKGTDPRPRTERPTGGRPRPTSAELTRMWEELLSLPAIPMGMPVRDESLDQSAEIPDANAPGGVRQVLVPGYRPRCEFCRDHFIQAGPPTAAELVKLSERSDPLRRFMDQVYLAWSSAGLIAVLGNYLAKPLLHHLAPEQALNSIGPAIGVPPRPPAPSRSHDHGRAGSPHAAPAAA